MSGAFGWVARVAALVEVAMLFVYMGYAADGKDGKRSAEEMVPVVALGFVLGFVVAFFVLLSWVF